ncbi:FBA1 [Symbiodinium natans]|uniref:fructose-bisphosphate aldolase n=1 Tax=Symbiodinium natans TaxID=878477 RepID=A0A812RE68_9DINO|nr:FBA1 [Symbiodinium natans]
MNPTAMGPRSAFMVSIQYFYTLLFCIELAIRAIGLGKEYFCSKEWVWAVLDIFIVATSIWEVLVDTWYALVEDGSTNLESVGGLGGLKAFRIIRITRIVKTVRLMRIFRFVLALRTLVHSILHTLKALFWALVLLFLIVYVFALIFTQAVNGYIFDPAAPQLPPEELEVSASFYGSLTDTMISLFMSVADGLSWEKIYRPLGLISPIWSFFFLFYICFVYFAVLNVLTAVFCQSAIESAQHDHATAVQNMMANKEMHLKKIRTLFNQLGTDESGSITFGQFESKIHSPEVREYFETLGLDVEDAWSFFKLLDRDGGGSVEIGEFLKGCLRFRGQARAIDIGQLLHDQGWLLRHQSRFHTYMEMEHQKLMPLALIGNLIAAFVLLHVADKCLPREQISSLKDLLTGSAGGTPRQRSRRPDKEQSLRTAVGLQCWDLHFHDLWLRLPQPVACLRGGAVSLFQLLGLRVLHWAVEFVEMRFRCVGRCCWIPETAEQFRSCKTLGSVEDLIRQSTHISRTISGEEHCDFVSHLSAAQAACGNLRCRGGMQQFGKIPVVSRPWIQFAMQGGPQDFIMDPAAAWEVVRFVAIARYAARTTLPRGSVSNLLPSFANLVEHESTLVMCTAALRACSIGQSWLFASQLVHQMQLTNTRPDEVTYGASPQQGCNEQSWIQDVQSIPGGEERCCCMRTWQAEPLRYLGCLSLVCLNFVMDLAGSFSFTAAGAACAQANAWEVALALSVPLEALFYELLGHQLGGFSAAISAAAKQSLWQLPLDLLGAAAKPSGAMYRAAIDACDRAGFPWHAQAVLVDSELNGAGSDPASFCWVLARLGVNDPEVIHGALAEAASAQKQHLNAVDGLPLLLWSCTMLGATNSLFQLSLAQEVLRRRAALSSDDLLLAAWGAPPVPQVFAELQSEMTHRLERPDSAELGESFTKDLLGVACASAAAGCLSAAFSAAARRWLRTRAAVRAARACLSTSPAVAPRRSAPGEPPQVLLDLSETACILKPSGWEVYDDNADRQLVDFVRRRFGCRISSDVRCRYGFIHRLDVPSSGLILAAKTHASYYGLHFQLAAGQISRRYLLLCHGFVAKERRVLTAAVAWRRQGEVTGADGGWRAPWRAEPSTAGGRGRPSLAALRRGAHGVAQVGAVSRLALRIATGRRHQLRSQLAHIGHPVVRDALYSSQWSFTADAELCQRNCLHRSGLGFRDEQGKLRDARAPLPDDLRECLDRVRLLREWPANRAKPNSQKQNNLWFMEGCLDVLEHSAVHSAFESFTCRKLSVSATVKHGKEISFTKEKNELLLLAGNTTAKGCPSFSPFKMPIKTDKCISNASVVRMCEVLQMVRRCVGYHVGVQAFLEFASASARRPPNRGIWESTFLLGTSFWGNRTSYIAVLVAYVSHLMADRTQWSTPVRATSLWEVMCDGRNEGYADSCQLMLIPSNEIGLNAAKQEATFAVYEAQAPCVIKRGHRHVVAVNETGAGSACIAQFERLEQKRVASLKEPLVPGEAGEELSSSSVPDNVLSCGYLIDSPSQLLSPLTAMSFWEIEGMKAGVVTGDVAWNLSFSVSESDMVRDWTAPPSAKQELGRPCMVQFSEGGSAFLAAWMSAFPGLKIIAFKAGKSLPNEKGKLQASILGAVAGAHFVRAVAPAYGYSDFGQELPEVVSGFEYGLPVLVHSDHCAKKLLPWFDGMLDADEAYFKPLRRISLAGAVVVTVFLKGSIGKQHGEPLFSSHMLDLSEEPDEENIEICAKYLKRMAPMNQILEMEIGITGGVEDGVDNTGMAKEKLYSTPEDVFKVYQGLSPISEKFTIAAAFGNVHGVYKAGNVVLKPELLNDMQAYASEQLKASGKDIPKPLNFVFHGGSGSEKEKIETALNAGVVKMNVDTDTQWAYWEGLLKFYKAKEGYLQGQIGNPEGEDKPNKCLSY